MYSSLFTIYKHQETSGMVWARNKDKCNGWWTWCGWGWTVIMSEWQTTKRDDNRDDEISWRSLFHCWGDTYQNGDQ